MNDRPTPETDAIRFYLKTRTTYDLTDFEIWENHSAKLESERDEARETAEKWKKLHDAKDELFKKGIAEVERERDEAREALEAVNALEEMHAKPGSMEIAIKQNPAQAQWVAKCFASMVAASTNYTEMKFDLVAEGEKWEWLTVLIQKGNGKTPHQLRQEAEKERDEAREALRGILRIVESFSYSTALGKSQLERFETAKRVLETAK